MGTNGTYQRNMMRGRSASCRGSEWSWLLTPRSRWWPPPRHRCRVDSLSLSYLANCDLVQIWLRPGFDPVLQRKKKKHVRTWSHFDLHAKLVLIKAKTNTENKEKRQGGCHVIWEPNLLIKQCCLAACLPSTAALSPARCFWLSVSG